MKTRLSILILAASLVFLSACASHQTNLTARGSDDAADVAALENVYQGENTTLMELDATARLDQPANRLERFLILAHRPSLGPAGQIHLVDLIWPKLDTDEQRKSVILTLIANPGFRNAGKQRVLATLARFRSDDDKKAVLEAIDRRGDLAS